MIIKLSALRLVELGVSCVSHDKSRGVPIIGSVDILAADMTFLPISLSVQNNRKTDITTNVLYIQQQVSDVT